MAGLKAECESGLGEAKKESREISEGIEDILKEITGRNNKLSGYNMLYEKKAEQKKKLSEEYNESELNIRSLKSRSLVLRDLENSMEGFAGSVKSVVSAGKKGRLKGIRGTVAGIISVDAKYSLAIETALGGGLQNIVVENEDAAKAGIRFLKETNGGRATFLPMTSVRGNTLSERNLDMQEGYVALASELVSYEDEYKGIIASLLGRIVIAENIDLATNIAKKYGYKFRIITIDGQVINAGGSFTGGSSSRTSGVLSRKNEIKKIESEISALEAKNKQLSERLSAVSAEAEKLGLELSGERETISQMESDKIRFEEELKRVELIRSSHSQRLSEIESSKRQNEEKINSLKEGCRKCEAELESVCNEIVISEADVSSANERSGESRNKRDELSKAISDKKLSLVELEKDAEAARLALEQLKNGLENSKAVAREYTRRAGELENLIAKEQENIDERNRQTGNSKAVIEQLNKRIREELDGSLSYEQKENSLRSEQRAKSDRKENVSAEISRLNERIESVRKDNDGIIGQLWESYNLTVDEALAMAKEEDDIPAANKRLTELKNKIRALGSVNTEAIDEYKEVSERYEFLSGQLSDVIKSKEELEKLIFDLTKSMRELFIDSFNKISASFREIFVELFGGGKGELKLTDPENVLESGIEINVAPPGKVIKNLSLLSGGEQAFVAIAIYFAILKLRPSPFCILDEIEAALDDVNVTRYAQYLRNFTDTTQFILITHRRGTMEEADVLYGVTMQEKGVSKLLKMDVSQVSFSEDDN